MPTGRRVQLLEYPGELLVELARGGTFHVPPAIPHDSTVMGHWIDYSRCLGQIAIHSNSHELVRIGQVLPLVMFPTVLKIG